MFLLSVFVEVEVQSQRSRWGPRWSSGQNTGPGGGQHTGSGSGSNMGLQYGGSVRHVTYTKNCAVWRIPKSTPPRRSRRRSRHGRYKPASRGSRRWNYGGGGPPPPPSRQSSPVNPERPQHYYPEPRKDTCEGTKPIRIPGEINIIKEYEVGNSKLW